MSKATYRAWRLYMTACPLAFESGGTGVYQFPASRKSAGAAAVPLTQRDHYVDIRGSQNCEVAATTHHTSKLRDSAQTAKANFLYIYMCSRQALAQTGAWNETIDDFNLGRSSAMKLMNVRKTILSVALLTGGSILAASALAQPSQGGYGMGPGMMDGYGFGWMSGYGGIWAPILLVALVAGVVVWVVAQKKK